VPTVAPGALREYIARIFEAAGAPSEDAAEVATHLVGANLRGHDSHGVIRVSRYMEQIRAGGIVPGAAVEVERQSAASALVNGNWNFGQVVARNAMAIAIEKARAAGVAVVSTYRSAHAGRMGTYAEQAVEAGMAAMIMANNHGGGRLVAPFGGAERRLSTNPITFGFPTGDPEAPFVLDMATSAGAEGKVRVALNKGVPLPDGWLLDAEGMPTHNPAALYDGGAILPVGGPEAHKGFGLSMAVEGLAGALSPAGTSRPDGAGGQGIFMLALDLEQFAGRAMFESAFGDLIDYVRKPPYRAGFDEVLIAGEPERRRMRERASAIPLDEETWRQLCEAGNSVGVEPRRSRGQRATARDTSQRPRRRPRFPRRAHRSAPKRARRRWRRRPQAEANPRTAPPPRCGSARCPRSAWSSARTASLAIIDRSRRALSPPGVWPRVRSW